MPRWPRPFVYGLLALLAGCVALGVESWPLTSFRLFSQLRGPDRSTWAVVTVDRAGAEHAVDWAGLPPALKGWHATSAGMGRMGATGRDRVMRSWGSAVRATGADVAGVRVYRVVERVPRGPRDGPAVVVRRVLRYEWRAPGPVGE